MNGDNLGYHAEEKDFVQPAHKLQTYSTLATNYGVTLNATTDTFQSTVCLLLAHRHAIR